MIDRVAAVLSQVIEEELLPRFRTLRAQEVFRKTSTGDPEDVVTVVDQRVEAQLARALVDLLPGSIVVGEEAVHARPALLDALGGRAPAWLVDPLDGIRSSVCRIRSGKRAPPSIARSWPVCAGFTSTWSIQ